MKEVDNNTPDYNFIEYKLESVPENSKKGRKYSGEDDALKQKAY